MQCVECTQRCTMHLVAFFSFLLIRPFSLYYSSLLPSLLSSLTSPHEVVPVRGAPRPRDRSVAVEGRPQYAHPRIVQPVFGLRQPLNDEADVVQFEALVGGCVWRQRDRKVHVAFSCSRSRGCHQVRTRATFLGASGTTRARTRTRTTLNTRTRTLKRRLN